MRPKRKTVKIKMQPIHAQVHTYALVYAPVDTHTYKTHTHSSTHTQSHAHTHTYTHTHTHILAHTHIEKHTFTYIRQRKYS